MSGHHHSCQSCGAKTPCGGRWVENYDGDPEVICEDVHRPDGTLNPEFLCEGCAWAAEDAAALEAVS